MWPSVMRWNATLTIFLLLNNDTIVEPDFLSKLVAVAEGDKKIGLVNPKILYFEPNDRIWFAGGYYKPWQSFGVVRGVNSKDVGKFDETSEISFATGCAFLIKQKSCARSACWTRSFFLALKIWTGPCALPGPDTRRFT